MMISIFDMSTFKFDNGGFVMSIQPRTGLQIAKKSWFAFSRADISSLMQGDAMISLIPTACYQS
jgi:hypothetical protein